MAGLMDLLAGLTGMTGIAPVPGGLTPAGTFPLGNGLTDQPAINPWALGAGLQAGNPFPLGISAGMTGGGFPLGIAAGFDTKPQPYNSGSFIGTPEYAKLQQESTAFHQARTAASTPAGQQAARIRAGTMPGQQAAGVARSASVPKNAVEFYQQYMPAARQVETETGIPASVMLAVAGHESGYGSNELARNANNLFSVKGQGYSMPAWEVVNGQNVTVPSQFRSYPDAAESFRDFARLMQTDRYAGAYNQRNNPQQMIRAIQQAGYATDPNWANAVQNQLGQISTVTAPVRTPTGAPITSGISQFGQGLSDAEARAACGPAAATWFVQNFGRNPTVLEAMQIAKNNNLWAGEMRGPSSEVELIRQMGVNARQAPADTGTVAREIQAGRPVVIDTPGHYFQVTAYNENTGEFRYGDAVGNGQWATLDQIGRFGYGAARTAIILGQ